MGDECAEAHDAMTIGCSLGGLLGFHHLGRFGLGNRRGSFCPGGLDVCIVEQKRRQGLGRCHSTW